MILATYAHNGFGRREAMNMASLLSLPFVERNKKSISTLCEDGKAKACLVWTKRGPVLATPSGQEHYFHLSMAQLRLLRLMRGEKDHLLEAVGLDAASVLDATAGLGSDSIILSYGLQVPIVAREGFTPLAFITNYGLRHFVHEAEEVTKALRRIQVGAMSYESYLKGALSNSVDVIYFDTMFEEPIMESSQFDPLRSLLVERPLTVAILEEAKRVAKKRIVIKERKGASLFERLGITKLVGGKYSRITYGVLEV